MRGGDRREDFAINENRTGDRAMTNIDVVRKRSTNVWLWVIVLIILAIVVFAFFALRGGAIVGSPVSDLIGPSVIVTTRVVV
jgi:hypothetical protein